MRVLLLIAVLSCATVSAQQPDVLVRSLTSGHATEVEQARRQLCTMPVASLPLDSLTLLLDGDAGAALASASVLAHHGVSRPVRRALLARVEPALQMAVLDLAEDRELEARLDHADPELRIAALHLLTDRGRLSDAALAAALADEDRTVARAALRSVLLERSPFPIGLLAELSDVARQRLVEGLGERPRVATAAWLLRLLERGVLQGNERLAAIAALPRDAIGNELAREIIAAAGEPGMAVAVHQAALRLPTTLVDRLVGAAHARLAAGASAEDVLACLQNASPLGERQVLSLSRVLPPATIERICSWLSARESEGLNAHIATALDGEVPLEPHLLRRAGPQINSPARVDRVLRVLRDGPPDQKLLAFHALVDANIYRVEMLDFAATDHGDFGEWSNRTQRMRSLLRVSLQQIPADVVLGLLEDHDPKVRVAVCRALITSPYPIEVEAELLHKAESPAVDDIGAAAGRAVASFGSRAAIREMWDRSEQRVRLAAVDWLRERPKPWTVALLREMKDELGERGADPHNRELRDELLRGLAVLGDSEAADELLTRVAELPLPLLRRCGEFAPAALTPAHVERLGSHLLGPREPLVEQAREEVVDWLAARPDLDVEPILSELYRSEELEEVRLAALTGLLRGRGAPAFHQTLREALVRPMGSAERDLAFEILANVPRPVRLLDLETIARLVLLAPLADPRGECRDTTGGFPRSGDYPMDLPIVDVLRRQDEVDPRPFAVVAEEVGTHAARYATSGRRLGHLLCELARFERLRETIGPVLARLILQAPDDPRRFAGLAHLILAEQSEDRGEWVDAAEHYVLAARDLLRQPLPPLVQRVVLGDTSLPDGFLPEAALSARPHLCRAHAAIEAGDRDAARAALAIARDLGAEDRAIEQEVAELSRRMEK